MSRPVSNRRNVSILLGIVAVVGFASWTLTGRSPHLPGAVLEAVPQGTTAVLHVDLPALLSSRLWQRLVVERGGGRAVERIEELCGVGDPLSELGKVTAFASGDAPGDLEHVGFVARGHFDPEALGGCVRRAVEADGGELRQTEIDGVPAVRGSGSSRVAFIGRDGIAGGDEETVAAIISALRGDSASAARDPVLTALFGSIAPGRDVVAVAHVPEGWRRALRERLRASTDTDLGAVAGVRAVGIGAGLRRGLSIETVMRMPDEGEAVRATFALERLVDDALSATGFAAAVTAPLLRRLSLEAREHEVRANLTLSPERLESAIDIAIAIWDAPPGRAEPETIPNPEPDEIIRQGD